LLPSIFIIPNDFAFVIGVIKAYLLFHELRNICN